MHSHMAIYTIGASLGCTLFSYNANKDAPTLLKEADSAMYEAKKKVGEIKFAFIKKERCKEKSIFSLHVEPICLEILFCYGVLRRVL